MLKKNYVLNDKTIEILKKQSLLQAQMGCDVIAPSDMMDGRIGKIRKFLDKNGYHDVQLLSYAVKYASNFYGPFRDAVGWTRYEEDVGCVWGCTNQRAQPPIETPKIAANRCPQPCRTAALPGPPHFERSLATCGNIRCHCAQDER